MVKNDNVGNLFVLENYCFEFKKGLIQNVNIFILRNKECEIWFVKRILKAHKRDDFFSFLMRLFVAMSDLLQPTFPLMNNVLILKGFSVLIIECK